MKAPTCPEFSQLRQRARDRTDPAIAAVQKEYRETLAEIADLEQRLLGHAIPDKASLAESVNTILPRDEEFTVTDLMRQLEALDPGRVWRMTSVIRHITALRDKGLVRRVQRHNRGRSAVYVRSDKNTGPMPNDRPLRDVVRDLVKKPMRTTEVIVAILAAGWKTTMKPEHFRAQVRSRLRQAGFKEVGEVGGRFERVEKDKWVKS